MCLILSTMDMTEPIWSAIELFHRILLDSWQASRENGQENTGEVELLAVHPAHQNQGIGTELNHFALEKMKASGMKLAIVATGGDPGHAPARRTYEKAGYTALPSSLLTS